MAEAKSPAATCSAARLHLLSHLCGGDMPGVGAANTAAADAAASTPGVVGRSMSCAAECRHTRQTAVRHAA